jgi:methylthioribose-1-phosphate isomerase
MRTVEWYEGKVRMIDQRVLPWELVLLDYDDYRDVAAAITDMVVRGAPAIGAAAAFGMALAAFQSRTSDRLEFIRHMEQASRTLKGSRPTAVNLAWGVDRMLRITGNEYLSTLDEVRSAILDEAQQLADEDVEINRRMGAHGATLIKDGDTILHHCNTGSLATVEWGTALGVVRSAHEQGKRIHVLLDETRPRLQGARLSAWELKEAGIPFEIIADNASGHFMRTGQVNIALVGSDRTAANGDVANKIGTYNVAVLAKENGIPFYPVVPTSTVDLNLATGDLIPIEERDASEVPT